MRKMIFFLLTIWISSSACEGRYPLKVDFEIAEATIIGREVCSTDTSLNAWLIDLGPTFSGKTTGNYYGSKAMMNGKQHSNVVKAYSPLVNRLDTTKQYVLDFYTESNPTKPSCNLSGTVLIDVPQIRVKEVSFKG